MTAGRSLVERNVEQGKGRCRFVMHHKQVAVSEQALKEGEHRPSPAYFRGKPPLQSATERAP
eukprot:776383-Lingulodinium_polyedra.AAC.1